MSHLVSQTTDLIDAPYAELAVLTTDELKVELARAMELTASHLLRLAAIVRLLEERGEDLSELRIGLVSYLRRIAYKQLLPAVVVRFAAFPALLQRVSQLPLPDQERLAGGESIRLVEATGDHRMVDPLKLTYTELRQAFGREHIRDESEQIIYLRDKAKDVHMPGQMARGTCRADVERGGIVVRRTFVPVGDVLQALADLRHDYIVDDSVEQKSVPVVLTAEEHRRIKVLAAQSDCTLQDLIRRALYAHGLCSER